MPLIQRLSLAAIAGAGLVGACRPTADTAVAATPGAAVRVAVMPFEDVGDSADSYLVEGVTDAVRGKLVTVPGLEVIGSASSNQYRTTTKTPQQIAKELGVQYLLIGKVRPAKGAGGARRLTVDPVLVDAGTAADKWTQSFDAPIADIFAVEGTIAGKVARTLQITLTPAAEQALSARPTSNLAAYDAYLQGLHLAAGGTGPAALHRTAIAFQDAIARDSTFALAWARLGATYSVMYANGAPSAALGDSADRATARAVALAPDVADTHSARASYYSLVRTDNARSLDEADAGLARSPNSVTMLRRASIAEEELGRWDAASTHAEQAAALDPRDQTTLSHRCEVELWRRHYQSAHTACTASLALHPDDLSELEANAMLALAQGDLAGAQRVIHDAPATVDRDRLLAYLATYWDLYWTCDSAQTARLLTLGPAPFDGDRATRAIVLAEVHAMRGERTRARVFADTARALFEQELRAAPDDDQKHLFLGMALAYLGDKAGAIREAQRGTSLVPISKDARTAVYNQYLLARIYLIAGEPEKALDVLEPLQDMPFYVSPAWLALDPQWTTLRVNPRFRQLASR